MKKIKYIHEREIHLIDLNPTKGVEIKKSRPCLILRKYSRSLYVVLPITSQKKKGSNFILLENINCLDKKSWISCAQIRAIDVSRIFKYLGTLSQGKFKEIQKIMGESLKILPRGLDVQKTKKKSLRNQKMIPSPIQKE